MSRYNEDIPEAFRRAFEEAGWRGGGNDDDDERKPPRSAHPVDPWWTNRWVWIVGLAILLFASFSWIVNTYTEWLWFSEVGYASVWLKQWGAQVVSFLIFFAIAAVVLLLNWQLARRRALRPAQAGIQPLTLPGIKWLITGAALFMAFILGQAAAGRWETFLRYLYRVPYGSADPIFEQDIGFYLFELPVYNFLQGWFMPLIIIALLGTAIIYVANNLPALRGRSIELRTLPAALRQHVAILLFFFFGLWALSYWLNTYELLYSRRGVAFGASYTDLNAQLPALWIQLGLMVLVALAAAYLAWRPDPRPLLIAGAIWLVGSFGAGALYPGLLQRYAVEPNELAREEPYIEHNIAFTRMGFGLDDVEVIDFVPGEEVTDRDIRDNQVAIQNIRLWDYRPLLDTYSQLQELRTYYSFNEIDIDRYEIEGQPRQVMLSARELDKTQVESESWVNQRLIFTHGYGVVMNPVDRVTPQGRPEFYIQDLPPRTVIPSLEITRPEVYYGELTTDVVYVNSLQEELDYPTAEDNQYSNYAGNGGVPLSGWLQRLAFAFRFGETDLVLSDDITPETRAMLHRQIQARVFQIAPFLRQDHDPYLVVADGRLVWMLDTYTVSDRFPYSEPSTIGTDTIPPGINYIRNSVKVTIDAYDGDVNFYVADPDDPIIQTYAKVFPGLFQPFEEIPATLQEHIRYPEGLFRIQTHQYLVYHMDNVQVFYNKEDRWQIPQEVFQGQEQPMEPYYVIFSLPDVPGDTEFLLIQPYTPNDRQNMIAWIAARNDPEVYGELIAYEMPRQELVFGPSQVEARINQDPDISQQLSLWDQRGSSVIRGNLIVVPINDTFLYVEPIYLRSDTGALPELKRIILASGETIVMRETLDEALAALLEAAPAVDQIVEEPPVAEPVEEEPVVEEPAGEQPEVLPTDATVDELIQAANTHFEAAEAAQRAGDWTTYGQEQEALGQVLEQLLQATGAELPAGTGGE